MRQSGDTKLIEGRDGIVRGVILRVGKEIMERGVQHLYPMELRCDRYNSDSKTELNPSATIINPIPNATAHIDNVRELENSLPVVE